MDERRRYRRCPILGWAEVVQEGKSETVLCYVKEISERGIGLYAQKAIPRGVRVELSLNFLGPKGFKTVKGLRGAVSWSFERETLRALGICFDEDVSPENHPDLYTALEASRSAHTNIEKE